MGNQRSAMITQGSISLLIIEHFEIETVVSCWIFIQVNFYIRVLCPKCPHSTPPMVILTRVTFDLNPHQCPSKRTQRWEQQAIFLQYLFQKIVLNIFLYLILNFGLILSSGLIHIGYWSGNCCVKKPRTVLSLRKPQGARCAAPSAGTTIFVACFVFAFVVVVVVVVVVVTF